MKADPKSKSSSPGVFAEPQLGKQTIPRQATGGVTPLSFGQQRMWFAQQLDPTSPVYNTYRTWRVRGALNVAALQKAFETIVARHEVLRGVIQVIDGEACQVTNEEWTFQLPCIDLRECASEAPEIVAKEMARQEAKTPFDLSRGPLFRAKLLRLDDEDHVLLISVHHVVTDGWSFGVLYREISVLYQAFAGGGSSPLPDLPLQYGDYAIWQHDFIQGARQEKLFTYWRRQLSHLTPLQLPTDRIRPSAPTFKGERQAFTVGRALTAKLKGWYEEERVTLFMTLLTCFKVLLFRYSGQADIAVGTLKHNRLHKEIEPLIGMFMNTLVLRTDLSANPSFRELLQHVRNTCKGAYAHEELPFDRLVDDLQPERDMSRNPLFQVAISYQNTAGQLLESSGLAVSPFESSDIGPYQSGNDTSKFDLILTLLESDDEIQGMLEYSTDLFDRSTIRRMVGHLQTLIEGVVADPDQRISEIPLFRENERRELLAMGYGPRRAYPENQCIQQLFAQQAAESPQAVALVFESQSLTYQKLNTRANQLAHYLQRHGVGPEVRVGLCLDRSIEMIVAMLGILKAGGAYVPLDPNYPQERLAFIARDADLRVILTQEKLQEHLSQLGAEHICLDADWPVIGLQAESTPVIDARADSLAYVIYTSGSTGRPKGVEVEHRQVVNYVDGILELLQLPAGSSFATVSPLTADLGNTMVFPALATGGALHIISEDRAADPEALGTYFQHHQPDCLKIVPSHLATLLMGAAPAGVLPQKRLVVGGESCPWHLVEKVQALRPACRVINHYGPTETTVGVTTHQVEATKQTSSNSLGVPIGRPLANSQIYILDAQQNPVPLGVAGEVCIAGSGLARGYRDAPELTAEKFVPHPCSEQPGARLYKTGDRARFEADGTIEFLGRIDHQVKLRGFRVELGEIESVLADHLQVPVAVGLYGDETEGSQRLIAYIGGEQDSLPRVAEIRTFLKSTLPDHMIPANLVFLESLPVLPNGKIDRHALPDPEEVTDWDTGLVVEPRNLTEEIVVSIWTDVLQRERVSLHDNFFDLGGHSLLATQVVSRIRESFHITFPLRTFFAEPTVAGLAASVETIRNAGQELRTPPLVPVSREEPLRLSFAQQRLWFLQQLDPDSIAYNVPLALRFAGALDVNALQRTLEEIVRRHAVLRTTFTATDEYPVQQVAPAGPFVLPVVEFQDCTELNAETEARRLAAAEALRPFDLASGPHFRMQLLRLGPEDHVLLITLHHIVSDGWTRGVLCQELASLYDAFVDKQPFPLPPLPVQYADFAHWQRQWFTGEVLEQQLSYWRDQLADLTPLELPLDRPRPPIQTYTGAHHSISLGQSLTEDLQALSRKTGVTLAITLMAAFNVLLARQTGQTDLTIGSPIANRNRREIEGLIGFFVNTLVMRTDLSGDPTFREVIARVREVALGAYDHQDLPFEQLVEELQPERDPSRNPLFQVMFAVQNAPAEAFTMSGVTAQPFSVEVRTTHFDLECHIRESHDGVEVDFVYNTDLFEPATIERLSRNFHRTLDALARDPEQRLSQVSLLDEAERQQILVEWNATQTAYPREATLAERFEAQVAATPDAVALVFADHELTYGQLNARANQLARYLYQQYGVGPEVCVGLCLERSVEMVVGLLGILKAGGAYVPLDPGTPPERMAFMLKDADIALVLAQDAAQASLPGEWAGSVIALDTEWAAIANMPATNVTSGATAGNLAYIMYTSGSTGVPKGTSICQRNVVRLVTNTNYLDFGAAETMLQLAPLAFDASTLELWGSLLHGARLVIFPPHQPSLEELGDFIQEHEISTLWLTAALFHQMVDSQLEALCGVRQLLSGGDVLSVPHVQRVVANLPEGGRLINGYGPTENTTFTCCHVMTRESPVETTVPIGRPIANTQAYVLDQEMQPVPVGVYGELYIGGDGLARNYLQRPTLTAEWFVPHPFSDAPGARLYRTGDVVRYRSDGTLEFQGRRDNQVKVRGHRIELGEIETVLGQHPGVQECVAWVREDEPGQKRLVGYVVPVKEPVSPSALRQYLQERMPDYMVPAYFVMLDAMPLTPNGKVDRKSLPAPDGVRPELDSAYQAPRSGAEQTLAQLWEQVLRIDRVGRQDNFFELGGDSILSIQIVAKANQAGLLITPRHLFQYQTIAELAAVVGSLEQVTADQSVVTGPLPLSPVQHWFFDQQLEGSDHWNMSWVLEATQPIDPTKMEQVVEFLLKHHDALRLRFAPHSNGWQQEMVGATNEPIPFTVVDLSHVASTEAEAAFTQEADRLQSSLNLTDGPLIRVALFQFGEGQADRVLLVIHHLAVDGISWRILLDDLQTAYEQLCERNSIQLPAKTSSFKEWTERLVEYAQSNTLHAEADYWRAVANTPRTPIPRDFADGINTVASTRTVSVVLGREDTRALLQEIPDVYHTQINDVLLTALVDVLAQWSQRETVCLDLEGHGREDLVEDIDLSRTVGWFTSIFPVVLRGGPSANPGELLKSVKEQLRQIPVKGIGYGLLRYLSEDGKIRDQLGEMPDPEVAFNYLGQFDQVIPSDGRWTWSGASGGANRELQGKQPYRVAINARIMDSVLQVQWSYSEAVHRRETIETLANNYLAALLATIRHCQLPDVGGYTPSDFPLAKVSQADLDKALTGIKTGQGKSAFSDLYPLTPLQQGLWFYALLDPVSGMYFEQSVQRIDGVLNRDVFRRAWEEVLARHAVLRTRIVWEGLEHPLQLVQSRVELPWAEQDWRGSPDKEDQSRLLEFLDTDRAKGFDLTQAPLMRLTLLQVAENSAILVWSFHHLILDRWSVDVVQREVWSAYQALVQGQPLPFNSLRPYREYLGWLQDQDLDRAEQYWRHLLRGFTEPTVLGVDQAPSTRVGHQESCYDSEEVALSEAATTALSRWARQQQLTVNTVVQGALAVLLSRYSDSEDVVFGVTVSGRSAALPGIETMVGLFINTLPVRVQVSPGCSLVEWLRELQEQQVSLREYEHTPLFEIQKWSEVPPEAPLFNTLLVFENTPQESDENSMARDAGLNVQRVAGRRGGETNYSLVVMVVPGRTLQLRFTYNTEHYTAEAITRMVGHFQQVLAGVVG